MKYLTLLLFSILSLSCVGNKHRDTLDVQSVQGNSVYKVEYAKGFTVNIFDDYKEVLVRDPWDTTKILERYILADKSIELPVNLPKGTLIRTPLQVVIAYSTIHCATLNEIGVIRSIKGVCEPQYIDIPYIQNGVSNGTIANLGQAANPLVEKIIETDPEAIFATPIQGRTYGSVDKTGIPIIETPDYMEATPLGRAEWIRFYSLFYNNEQYVDSLFQKTVESYNSIKEKTLRVENRPTVFLDLMYGSVWYTSGGDSFISKMLGDAGATYVWHKDRKNVSTPLAFEQVLDQAGDSEYWLIKYNKPDDLTYSNLEKEYKPYSYFMAYKNKNIYECNTGKRSYYEDLPIHPDYILQDFAYIFHPELFLDYKPRYYSKMKE